MSSYHWDLSPWITRQRGKVGTTRAHSQTWGSCATSWVGDTCLQNFYMWKSPHNCCRACLLQRRNGLLEAFSLFKRLHPFLLGSLRLLFCRLWRMNLWHYSGLKNPRSCNWVVWKVARAVFRSETKRLSCTDRDRGFVAESHVVSTPERSCWWRNVASSASAEGSFVHEGQKWTFTRGGGGIREKTWNDALGPLSNLPCHVGPSTLASGTSLNPLHNFASTCEAHLPFCTYEGIEKDEEYCLPWRSSAWTSQPMSGPRTATDGWPVDAARTYFRSSYSISRNSPPGAVQAWNIVEMIENFTHMFQMGWLKPPTRLYFWVIMTSTTWNAFVSHFFRQLFLPPKTSNRLP